MGCGASIACIDCKKSYYLGYGSYSSWIYAESVEDFDSKAKKVVGSDSDEPWTKDGRLRKNQNLRQVLSEHAGHELRQWIDDSEYGVHDGTLYAMGSYGTRGAPLIEHYDTYEHINMDT